MVVAGENVLGRRAAKNRAADELVAPPTAEMSAAASFGRCVQHALRADDSSGARIESSSRCPRARSRSRSSSAPPAAIPAAGRRQANVKAAAVVRPERRRRRRNRRPSSDRARSRVMGQLGNPSRPPAIAASARGERENRDDLRCSMRMSSGLRPGSCARRRPSSQTIAAPTPRARPAASSRPRRVARCDAPQCVWLRPLCGVAAYGKTLL